MDSTSQDSLLPVSNYVLKAVTVGCWDPREPCRFLPTSFLSSLSLLDSTSWCPLWPSLLPGLLSPSDSSPHQSGTLLELVHSLAPQGRIWGKIHQSANSWPLPPLGAPTQVTGADGRRVSVEGMLQHRQPPPGVREHSHFTPCFSAPRSVEKAVRLEM